jgi:predicted ribosome quality control (RQC) complex YloA/Tae2 family protein
MFLDEVAEKPKVTLVGEIVRASAELASKMEEARERARQEVARQEAAEKKKEDAERNQEQAVVLSESLTQLAPSGNVAESKDPVGEEAEPRESQGSTVNVSA